MEWIRHKQTILRVKKIPGDGNCLFSAILDQLKFLKIAQSRNWDIKRFRNEVADYIIDNLSRFGHQIQASVAEASERYKGMDPLRRSATYIADLRRNGFWGGAETIDAACNLFSAAIMIFQKDGSVINFTPYNGKGNFTMKLLYRNSEGSIPNHYDSIRFSASAPTEGKPGPLEDKHGEDRNTRSESQKLTNSEYFLQRVPRPIKGFDVEARAYQQDREDSLEKRRWIKIATWNVRGGSTQEKKRIISSSMKDENIDIGCLQETHLTTGQFSCPNYTWHLSGGNESKTFRGVAILTRDNEIQMEEFSPLNENIGVASVIARGQRIIVMTCHIPSEAGRASQELGFLSGAITEHNKAGNPIIIAGDFNAHLGLQDIGEEDRKLIGEKLRHQHSNENGNLMKNLIILHGLTVNTSWSDSNSVLTTWSNGNIESQIDHILSVNGFPGMTMWCKARWIQEVATDHKLVFAKVIFKDQPKEQTTSKGGCTGRRKWNVERLKCKDEKKWYRGLIREEIEILHSPLEGSLVARGKPSKDKWEELSDIISVAATKALNCPNSPMTPKRRRAIADQQKAKFRRNRPQLQLANKEDLKEANKKRAEAFEEHENTKCENFFKNLSNMHPLPRMREAYKFLKQYRRKTCKKNRVIPMTKWEEEARGEESGPIVETIDEGYGAGASTLLPPSVDKVKEIIRTFKKGSAPGVDGINIELLQEGPQELIEELTRIIEEAWNSNIIPKTWNHTIQIPIPKVKAPKAIEDYRRISLCSVAYKIYAKCILERLDESIPPLPQYQGAFLANRSTEDHIFTIRRITEEAWREGRIIYILALDLAKAFPSVNHRALVAILKDQKVPPFLINRIIKACLHEKTAIQWYGQTTRFRTKSVGVKQGCPISPRLFTIVLNAVISTTVEVLSQFDLQEKVTISLPILLAYADDLIVIAEKKEDLSTLLKELIPNLQSTGMTLNEEKCELLIRDPKGIGNSQKEFALLDQHKVKIVQCMRYLGTYLTSSLNRRGSTRIRIENAIKGARMLIPFLKKHRPPWSMTRTIYNTIIAPVALYGMKATATTKANRCALKSMESLILSLMAQHCRNLPSRKIAVLLEKKTIWRKVMNQRLKYWGHVLRRPTNNILQAARRIRPANKKIGRPCFSWNDSVNKDIRCSKIPRVVWEEEAKDKEKLKKLANKIYDIVDSSDEDEIVIW